MAAPSGSTLYAASTVAMAASSGSTLYAASTVAMADDEQPQKDASKSDDEDAMSHDGYVDGDVDSAWNILKGLSNEFKTARSVEVDLRLKAVRDKDDDTKKALIVELFHEIRVLREANRNKGKSMDSSTVLALADKGSNLALAEKGSKDGSGKSGQRVGVTAKGGEKGDNNETANPRLPWFDLSGRARGGPYGAN